MRREGEGGREGGRAGRDLSSLNPLNPPRLPPDPLAWSRHHVACQVFRTSTGTKGFGFYVFVFFFLFMSDETQLDASHYGRYHDPPPPHPFPPGFLKLALFLPIAPFFLFFNLPQKEVGREIGGGGEGGRREGGGGVSSFLPLAQLSETRGGRNNARAGTAARSDEREGDTGGRVA